MKKMKLLPLIFTFMVGIGAGIMVGRAYFSDCENGFTKPFPAGSIIDVETANTLFLNYNRITPVRTAKFKGFIIGLDQLWAISELLKTNSDISAFRIYPGLDDSSRDSCTIIVAVTENGQDATENYKIYRTAKNFSDPCPPNCDWASVITRGTD